ncbi:hypothetical protein GCK32_007140, partial [Trichostrongylus colubriformis]
KSTHTTMSCASFGDEAPNFMMVWEVEAAGRMKIVEAKERRLQRIKEAKYQALVEIEEFREEKEAEFQEKYESMKESIQEVVEKAREQTKRELEYMEKRVKLCKPLVGNILEFRVNGYTYVEYTSKKQTNRSGTILSPLLPHYRGCRGM